MHLFPKTQLLFTIDFQSTYIYFAGNCNWRNLSFWSINFKWWKTEKDTLFFVHLQLFPSLQANSLLATFVFYTWIYLFIYLTKGKICSFSFSPRWRGGKAVLCHMPEFFLGWFSMYSNRSRDVRPRFLQQLSQNKKGQNQ